jgi:hypothetical protein
MAAKNIPMVKKEKLVIIKIKRKKKQRKLKIENPQANRPEFSLNQSSQNATESPI